MQAGLQVSKVYIAEVWWCFSSTLLTAHCFHHVTLLSMMQSKIFGTAIQQEFTVEDQGNVNEFLGIQVKKHDDGTIHLMQLQLINSILKDLHVQDNTSTRDTPALST